jgi:hypothetical protein
MYIEGFEGLEEAERGSKRSYGSTSEIDRLMRENEKLKQSLEKEQFFNKLLDQEIQDMKNASPGGKQSYPSEYWSGAKTVSRGAFYFLLFITLLMGAYIGYGIYYDKPFNYLGFGKLHTPKTELVPSTAVATIPPATAQENTTSAETPATLPPANSNEQTNTKQTETKPPVAAASVPAAKENVRVPASTTPPATKDSVPNIIGSKKPAANQKTSKAAVVPTPDEEYNEEEVNAVIDSGKETAVPAAPQPVADTRPILAKYKITSKANFYNAPDENTMRSTFISESANKTVGALEDKNGFIFVIYTNDLGFTSRGWLSKKDLTKE